MNRALLLTTTLIAVFSGRVALAQSEEVDAYYSVLMHGYGLAVVNAENCDDPSRHALTSVIMSELTSRRVDPVSLQRDLDASADSERPFSKGRCDADFAATFSSTALRHLSRLTAALDAEN